MLRECWMYPIKVDKIYMFMLEDKVHTAIMGHLLIVVVVNGGGNAAYAGGGGGERILER